MLPARHGRADFIEALHRTRNAGRVTEKTDIATNRKIRHARSVDFMKSRWTTGFDALVQLVDIRRELAVRANMDVVLAAAQEFLGYRKCNIALAQLAVGKKQDIARLHDERAAPFPDCEDQLKRKPKIRRINRGLSQFNKRAIGADFAPLCGW